jgi:hypothetical protein
MPLERTEKARLAGAPDTKALAPSQISARLRVAGALFRTLFIIALIAATVRVSLPQNETIWTAYDTTGDLIRVILGAVVCIWLVYQLFQMPRDSAGYRTWLYLGLAVIPFAAICLFAAW